MAATTVTALEWESETRHDGNNHIAYLPWRRDEFLASPYYRIYPWKGDWSFGRPEHPELGKMDGRVKTLREAKQLCEEDFTVVARLHRWHLHMINHEPPADV